jgi:hypothetical protein
MKPAGIKDGQSNGGSAQYILDDWDSLIRFLDHPDVPPDNKAAENALRFNALIRKNNLFIGSLAAGPRVAVAMTILHSCRLVDLNPTYSLTQVPPTLLLYRRGWQQNLAALTSRMLDLSRQGNRIG